jgi:enoyl-CoA hydratase
MSYNNLIYTIKDRVNTISINRPKKLNALNIETFSEIDHAVKSSVSNPDG